MHKLTLPHENLKFKTMFTFQSRYNLLLLVHGQRVLYMAYTYNFTIHVSTSHGLFQRLAR